MPLKKAWYEMLLEPSFNLKKTGWFNCWGRFWLVEIWNLQKKIKDEGASQTSWRVKGGEEVDTTTSDAREVDNLKHLYQHIQPHLRTHIWHSSELTVLGWRTTQIQLIIKKCLKKTQETTYNFAMLRKDMTWYPPMTLINIRKSRINSLILKSPKYLGPK